MDSQPLAITATTRIAASALNQRGSERELLIMFIDLAPFRLSNGQ
jgi:hypothetical protein